MDDKLIITKINEVYIHIQTTPGIEMELSEYFTFMMPGYSFHPKYQARKWDGKIRLFNRNTCLIYYGLMRQIEHFCQERNYPIESNLEGDNEFSVKEAEDYITSIKLDRTKYKDRDYQNKAFIHAIRDKRMVLISPTASGKSLIIYLICRYLLDNKLSKKILIVVPTVALVEQMTKDFIEYGWSEKYIQKIYSGESKDIIKPVTISTWQSLFRLEDEFFLQFDAVVGDEAHEQKSTETKGILERLVNAQFRIGTTGTMHDAKTHKLVLEGLFGPIIQFVTTKELMDRGDISQIKIKAILLDHTIENKQLAKDFDYNEELDYIVSHEKRNRFVKNLALSLDGNTLVLFRYVEKHGKVLYDLIKDQGKDVYLIYGKTEVEERELIRGLLEKVHNAVLIASTGTFSRGINVKNLHNVILSHPSKDKIKLLQSIGRSLRLHDSKEFATLFDIADDLRYKSKENITLRHFEERLRIYTKERFKYKLYKVSLKG